MSYVITITEKRTVTKTVGKEWKVIGQVEKPREPNVWQHHSQRPAEPVFIGDEYGYTPEIEKQVTEEREVLKQAVDALDLAAVIRAINGL